MTEPGDEAPCVLLEWDSAFWGFPIAQLVSSALSDTTYAAAAAWSADHAIRCLYLLAAADDVATARCAGDHSFKLVDERVTLGWHDQTQPLSRYRELPGDMRIRPIQPKDLPALQTIARSSHRDTRFFVDPSFPREKVHELYVRWITASCSGFADLVLVALLQGEVVGYCSCHLPANAADPSRIGLLAVSPAARGRGVARSLVEQAQDWFVQQGAARVTVVTQDRNVAALTLYQRCGFTIETRQHWYHRWFAEQANDAS